VLLFENGLNKLPPLYACAQLKEGADQHIDTNRNLGYKHKMAQVEVRDACKVVAPVDLSFYQRPYLLSAEGEELGEVAQGSIPPPDVSALRADLFKVRTTRQLAEWLNQAGYITANRTGWQAKDIGPALRMRFFLLRDILADWLTGATMEALRERFPSGLVEEVCWRESSAPEVLARAAITASGLSLAVYSPRVALILSVHIDRFWRGRRLFGRCPKCKVVFQANRPDKQFCTQRCKRAAGSLAYYHRHTEVPARELLA